MMLKVTCIASAVECFGNVAATASAQEGLAAFAEKRKPRWPVKA